MTAHAIHTTPNSAQRSEPRAPQPSAHKNDEHGEFDVLLQALRAELPATAAAPFAEGGVFGRDITTLKVEDQAPGALARACAEQLPRPRDEGRIEQRAEDEIRVLGARNSAVRAGAGYRMPAASPNQRTAAAKHHSTPPRGEAVQITFVAAPTPSRTETMSGSPRRETAATSTPLLTPSTAASTSVSVALQATDNGLRVFARVGKMAPSERARVRLAITALLAEHGVLNAGIELDADHNDVISGGM